MNNEQVHSTSRRRTREVVESGLFQRAVLVVILVNAVTIGLQTSEHLGGATLVVIRTTDVVVLVCFGVEMLLRLYAYGWRFFRDPWSWFDLIVVGLAMVPPTHYFSVVRVLRVLRLARLVSVVPSLRRVVAALLAAVPGIGSIILMLVVALYSGAVLGVQLFRGVAPEFFGNLGTSMLTMFEIMTLENWPAIAEPVVEQRPAAWVFFVGYIVLTAFILLNLLIGVIVSAMEVEVNRYRWQEDQALEERQHEAVMTELAELRALVEAVRTERAEAGELAGSRAVPADGDRSG